MRAIHKNSEEDCDEPNSYCLFIKKNELSIPNHNPLVVFRLIHWLKIFLGIFLFCLSDFCFDEKSNSLGENLANLLHYAATNPKENKLHREI